MLFQAGRKPLGAAFVVVTHLARDRESMLPEILGRLTKMPVAHIVSEQVIEPDHVYLLPPDRFLRLIGDRLVLEERAQQHNPIDVFFVSLAAEAGDRAVGVVLSGTGADGAIGIKAVRGAGGFTIAEDAATPAYADMPNAAIATGFVDCALAIDAIPDRLAGYIREYARLRQGQGLGAPEKIAALKTRLCAVLQKRTNHDFIGYKDKTFLRRVERRMQVRQFASLADYVDFVETDSEEANLLLGDLLIGVTNFFRDTEAFQALADQVIPRLFDGKGSGDAVRVWVPGCATGEEAYSIAVLLREAQEKLQSPVRLQVFATDVDERALVVARAGRYPDRLMSEVAPERLRRFFIGDGATYAVTKELRDICLFSSHSLIRDPPFSQIDLISCRNLLIYFNSELQQQVIPLFHYSLKSGGYLFLGASENLAQHADLFVPVDKKERVFRRRDLIGHRPRFFPILLKSPIQRASRGDVLPPSIRSQFARIEGRVLEKYAPAHVVINREWDIVHFSARTGKYIEQPVGIPSRNVLEITRPGLRPLLRAALHEAAETGHATQRAGALLELDSGVQMVDIAVEPLADEGREPLWLVVFSDVGVVRKPESAAELATEPANRSEIAHLENELQQTRERLQIIIEEYETSVEELKSANEELLSVNEELQSTNEELETSKEELQSVNEELHAVNSELAAKVDELDRANNDLRNLFDSTRIATIFLDRDLMVRSFTPAVSEIFKLIPSDRGRSLLDFATFINCDDLTADIHHAIATAEPIEKSVDRRDGSAHYLMRILPYRRSDTSVDGVVITFVNVSYMVEAEEHQRLLVAELNHRVKNVLAVVSSLAAQMAKRTDNLPDFVDGFLSRIRGLATTHEMLAAKEWSTISLGELIRAELSAFVDPEIRARISGPDVQLHPRAATTLGIAIHELATNALKYGALTNHHGHVEVSWSALAGQEGADQLVLVWREVDGPPVAPPSRKGLGSELIERGMDYELGGQAIAEYRPEGLVTTLSMPFSEHIFQPVTEKALSDG